jgi:hypothetical protein
MADNIDNYRLKYRSKSRTEAVTDLLEVALFIINNASKLEKPAVVKYLQENLYNVQLVDDITEWPQDRIEG